MNTYSHIQQDQITAAFEERKVTWQPGGSLSVFDVLKRLVLTHWNQYRLNEKIRAERLQLDSLTDEQLADIGITRIAAMQESRRPWGDVPVNRQFP